MLKAQAIESEAYGNSAVESTRGRQMVSFETICAFAFGLGLMIHFRLGVRISLTELISPFLVVFFSSNLSKLLQNKAILKTILLLVLYAVSVTITDFVRDVPSVDTIRSIVGVTFLFWLLITAGVILLDRTWLIEYIFYGLACGALLHWRFNTADDPYDFTSSSMQYAYYVFRFSPALAFTTSVVAYLLFKRGMRLLAILVMIASMLIAIYLTTRSACFSWLIAVAFCSSTLFRSRIDYMSILYPGRKMILLGLGLLVLSYGSYYLYKELATRGYLGSSGKARENLKDLGNSFGWGPVGLLMKGRTEVLASLLMIRDSPFIGIGSSADTAYYYVEAFRFVGKESSPRDYISDEDGKIRVGHSLIFHSWAANGILTLPFWIFVLYLLYRFALLLILCKSDYLALLGVLLSSILWDIVFSPISVQSRALIPMTLAFASLHSVEIRNLATTMLWAIQAKGYPNNALVPSASR